jgi:hypothetical protein
LLNNRYAIVPGVGVNPRHGQIIGNPLKLPPSLQNLGKEMPGKPNSVAIFGLEGVMQLEPMGR